MFTPPHESEFLSRGFDFSPAHDPNEAVLSYCRHYASQQVLTVGFTLGSETALHVSIAHGSAPVATVEMENLASMDFQSWHGERILRFYFSVPRGATDLRVHFEPEPRVYVSVLA